MRQIAPELPLSHPKSDKVTRKVTRSPQRRQVDLQPPQKRAILFILTYLDPSFLRCFFPSFFRESPQK